MLFKLSCIELHLPFLFLLYLGLFFTPQPDVFLGEGGERLGQPLEEPLFQLIISYVQHEGFNVVLLALKELDLDSDELQLSSWWNDAGYIINVFSFDFGAAQGVNHELEIDLVGRLRAFLTSTAH